MPNIPRSVLRRRRFLQSSGIVALGTFTTALAGRKFFSAPPSSRSVVIVAEPPDRVPDLLARSEPEFGPPTEAAAPVAASRPLSHEDEYADFLASLDLRHLEPEEIIGPHRGVYCGVANELPARKLWEKLTPALRVADELRERLGLPLQRISSAYRVPRYNLKIPGAARNSYHTRNQALDLVFGVSTREAVAMAQRLRRERFFRGGIGVYPTFVHIDTRGYSANWRG
jgi:hypothetical protein